MYTIFEKPESTSRLGSWEKSLGHFREVIGHTALGSIFLRNPDDRSYVALHPLNSGNNASTLGKFDSAAQFEAQVLGDAEMRAALCRPDVVMQLEKRLGKLKAHQVYYPVPYPMLGGSGSLASYDKGDLWAFADIVGQTLGVDEDEGDEPETTTAKTSPRPAKSWKTSPEIWTLIAVAVGLILWVLIRQWLT
jgi:hypothetical protein